MKKLLVIAGLLSSLFSISADANVISISQTYASGAVFTGSVNFQSNGELTSGTGTLTGSSYNNDQFGWIWPTGTTATFGQTLSPDVGYTWLVDNPGLFGILIEWNYANPQDVMLLASSNGVYNGPTINQQNIDPAVASTFGSVPEPSSIALLLVGLFGFGFLRYKKKN